MTADAMTGRRAVIDGCQTKYSGCSQESLRLSVTVCDSRVDNVGSSSTDSLMSH